MAFEYKFWRPWQDGSLFEVKYVLLQGFIILTENGWTNSHRLRCSRVAKNIWKRGEHSSCLFKGIFDLSPPPPRRNQFLDPDWNAYKRHHRLSSLTARASMKRSDSYAFCVIDFHSLCDFFLFIGNSLLSCGDCTWHVCQFTVWV